MTTRSCHVDISITILTRFWALWCHYHVTSAPTFPWVLNPSGHVPTPFSILWHSNLQSQFYSAPYYCSSHSNIRYTTFSCLLSHPTLKVCCCPIPSPQTPFHIPFHRPLIMLIPSVNLYIIIAATVILFLPVTSHFLYNVSEKTPLPNHPPPPSCLHPSSCKTWGYFLYIHSQYHQKARADLWAQLMNIFDPWLVLFVVVPDISMWHHYLFFLSPHTPESQTSPDAEDPTLIAAALFPPVLFSNGSFHWQLFVCLNIMSHKRNPINATWSLFLTLPCNPSAISLLPVDWWYAMYLILVDSWCCQIWSSHSQSLFAPRCIKMA